MLFRTYEPYCQNDDKKETIDTNGECFICFENTDIYCKPTIELNCQTQYLNNCQCNGNIHKICLEIWVEKNTEIIIKNKLKFQKAVW